MAMRTCVVLATCLFSAATAWSQSYGMGPGMMGGGGYGMGMGRGGYGMDPGMMGGYGPENWEPRIPNLTDEQRTKLEEIEKNYRQKQWQLMEKMHDRNFQSDVYAGGKFDEQAARKNYEAMSGLRKQMFENTVEERKRIDSITSPRSNASKYSALGETDKATLF